MCDVVKVVVVVVAQSQQCRNQIQTITPTSIDSIISWTRKIHAFLCIAKMILWHVFKHAIDSSGGCKLTGSALLGLIFNNVELPLLYLQLGGYLTRHINVRDDYHKECKRDNHPQDFLPYDCKAEVEEFS